jgi:hypothetical protein
MRASLAYFGFTAVNASSTGRLKRSNGSASLRILAISASMAGKSSSEIVRDGTSTS